MGQIYQKMKGFIKIPSQQFSKN